LWERDGERGFRIYLAFQVSDFADALIMDKKSWNELRSKIGLPFESLTKYSPLVGRLIFLVAQASAPVHIIIISLSAVPSR
jgi:hypothetical protein